MFFLVDETIFFHEQSVFFRNDRMRALATVVILRHSASSVV